MEGFGPSDIGPETFHFGHGFGHSDTFHIRYDFGLPYYIIDTEGIAIKLGRPDTFEFPE